MKNKPIIVITVLFSLLLAMLVTAPSANLTYNGSDDGVFYNRTEGNSTGVRLDAPILFMDFDKDPETYDAGYSLDFDGSNDCVEISSTFSTYEVFTISTWAKDETAGRLITTYNVAQTNSKYGIEKTSASAVRFFYRPSTGDFYYSSSYTHSAGAWNHFVLSYDGSNFRFYVNGVIKETKAATLNTADGGAASIGCLNPPSPSGNFNGKMDEFAFWNKKLTDEEIIDLYNSSYGDNGRYVDTSEKFPSTGISMGTNLQGLWHFDDGADPTADSSGNGRTGNLYNMDTSSDYLEGYIAQTHYVKDDSIENNYGLINHDLATHPTYNSSCGTTPAGNDLGGCYEFDGVDDYVSVGTDGFGSDEGSVSFWVYPLLNIGENAYMIGHQNGNNRLYLGDDSTIGIADSSMAGGYSLTLNQWQMITLTYNEGDWYTYKNGIQAGSGSYSGSITFRDSIFISACNGCSTQNNFNGLIDAVQIFDRALSADEILELYNGTINNSNYIGKYARDGEFTSLVFHNSTSSYWNTTMSVADSTGGYEVNLSDPNLVSYWELNGNAVDTMGRNNGTVTGTNNATGISSGAMRFDGVDDYVNFSNINVNRAVTLSAWINIKSDITSPISHQTILGAESDNWHTLAISYGLNNLRYRIYNGSTSFYTDIPYSFSVNRWYHVAVSRPNESVYFYVNDMQVGSASSSVYPASTKGIKAIGANYPTPRNYFNGSIDEVLIYNKSLTASEVTELYKAGLSQHANANVTLQTRVADNYNISDVGLVGLWGLNSNSSGVAVDETGVNNGTWVGGAKPLDESGVVGMGGHFDGVDDYIVLSDNPIINFSNAFTESFWIKPANAPAIGNGQLMRTTGSGQNQFYQPNGGNTLSFYTGTSVTTPSFLVANQWFHIVLTNNGTFTSIYSNGILIKNETQSVAVTGTLTLGGGLTSEYFNGSIDEVRIYNRSLSAAEIQNLYELGSYHIEWNDWQSQGKANDSTAITSTDYGNFMQYRANFSSDNTTVSPHLLNHSILEINTAPNVTEVNLTSTNETSNSTNENLTANVSANDINGDNITYAYNWYKNDTLNATSLITDGLVAYFPLNNDTLDYWGTNDGTNAGATRNTTDYKVGAAYTFDGGDDITMGDTGETFYSASLWFKPGGVITAATGYQSLLNIRETWKAIYIGSGTSDLTNEIIFINGWADNDKTGWCDGSASLSATWHHLVFAYNGTMWELWLDGEQKDNCYDDDSADGHSPFAASNVMLGKRADGNGRYSGEIDEVMILTEV